MTALYIALAVLLLIDWRQTLVIAQPGGWEEAWNQVLHWLITKLGPPAVHFWFALVAVAIAAACWHWPLWALWIAGACCVIEAAAVINNWSLGITP